MRNLSVVLLMMVFATQASGQGKETLSGNDVSVRTVLSFKVPDAAVRNLLPPGWELSSPIAGPAKGTNFSLHLIETLMVQDPDGKPAPAPNAMVFVIPAKNPGANSVGAILFGGFIANSYVPGVYGNYTSANVVVDRHSLSDAAGHTVIEETWQAKEANGNEIVVHVEFMRGTPMRDKLEAKVYSAVKPDFYRVYRWEQASDVALSEPTNVNWVSKFSIKATGS